MSSPRTGLTRRARQASHSVRRFFDAGNLFRFLVSIVLAFGLWALVTYQNDPETTRVMGGMTVTISNLDSDLDLVGDPPVVDVTLQGPQSVINPLERDSVTAIADMDDRDSPGTHEVEVTIDAPSDVRVREAVPDTVTVEIDTIEEIEDVSIVVDEPEDVPPNLQIAEIDVQPGTLTVTGPGRSVSDVEEARIDLQIAGRTGTFAETLEPVLIDENGEAIENLTIEPEQVTVTVRLDIARGLADLSAF